MKNSERNLAVIENFILHLTHCSGGEDNYYESQTYTPEELYRVAYDYIQEDHVDGKGAEDERSVYTTPIKFYDCDIVFKEEGSQTERVTFSSASTEGFSIDNKVFFTMAVEEAISLLGAEDNGLDFIITKIY